MRIANPIYDVVFKYLMEDSKAAKILLSTLLRQNIVELDFLPQEMSIDIGKPQKSQEEMLIEKHSITIYRMDFSAKIQTSEGEKQIIIELQKARLKEDITRFRSYLGKQYQNSDLFVWVKDSKKYKAGIPIYAIYFLGYELQKYQDIPVVLIENQVTDRFTEEILDKNEVFVNSLFHEGMIINIPALKGKRRDELEKLLSIFDQSNREENFHILNVNESDFDSEKSLIIRRLQAAIQSKEMREKMLAEDTVLSEIEDLERALDKAEAALEKNNKEMMKMSFELEKVNLDLEKERKLREEERQQKELAEQKAKEERQQKEALENRLVGAVKNLVSQGFEAVMIAQILGISENQVKSILES